MDNKKELAEFIEEFKIEVDYNDQSGTIIINDRKQISLSKQISFFKGNKFLE